MNYVMLEFLNGPKGFKSFSESYPMIHLHTTFVIGIIITVVVFDFGPNIGSTENAAVQASVTLGWTCCLFIKATTQFSPSVFVCGCLGLRHETWWQITQCFDVMWMHCLRQIMDHLRQIVIACWQLRPERYLKPVKDFFLYFERYYLHNYILDPCACSPHLER